MANEGGIVSLGPDPNPDSAYRPSVGYEGDNSGGIVPLNQPTKPILSTSFEKIPTVASSGKEWGDYFGRKLGLGTREVVEGRGALPLMLADAVTYPGRWINRQLGIPTTAPSDLVDKGLDAVGLPKPVTDEEKRNAELIRGGASMLGTGPLALGTAAPQTVSMLPKIVQPAVRPLVTGGAPLTAPAAATQVVAGGTGALAGDTLANSEYVPEGLKPTARVAGNILGAGGVSGVKGATELLTNVATGTKTDLAQAFERLGIKPTTMGAVSERPGVQSTEGLITKFPQATGRMQPRQQSMVDEFGRAVERTAQTMDDASSAMTAGEKVQSLMHDWKRNTFQAEQDAVWSPLNQRMSGAAVDPAPYRAALEAAASPKALASLPENQRVFASETARKWLAALDADAPGNSRITWEQAHAIKQAIGDAMGTPDLVASMGGNRLKSIYGGLAQSMENTATQHGQKGLFDAANKVTVDGHQFMDQVLSKGVKANNPAQETIDPAVAAQRLTESNAAMVALRARIPEAADALAAWQLRQNKLARPGQQGADNRSSTGTFLTQSAEDRLRRPEGTAALMKPVGGDLDDLMRVAAQLRETERRANFSGTSAGQQLGGALGSIGTGFGTGYMAGGVGTGLLGAAGALGTAVGLPWGAARILTSPALIKLMEAQPGTGLRIGPVRSGAISTQATMPDVVVKPTAEDRRRAGL